MKTLQIETVTLKDGSKMDVIRDIEAAKRLIAAQKVLPELVAALKEIVTSGISMEHAQIDYVEVQISKEFFKKELPALLAKSQTVTLE